MKHTNQITCRMTTMCAGCDRPINDKFIYSVIDRSWHEDCVQCVDCSSRLKDKCFAREGKIYCRDHYYRSFGPKCSKCCQGIGPSDLVQRIKDSIFHLHCFICSFCQKLLSTGEQLYLIDNNKFVCKEDYMKQQQLHQQQQQQQPPQSRQQQLKLKLQPQPQSQPQSPTQQQLQQAKQPATTQLQPQKPPSLASPQAQATANPAVQLQTQAQLTQLHYDTTLANNSNNSITTLTTTTPPRSQYSYPEQMFPQYIEQQQQSMSSVPNNCASDDDACSPLSSIIGSSRSHANSICHSDFGGAGGNGTSSNGTNGGCNNTTSTNGSCGAGPGGGPQPGTGAGSNGGNETSGGASNDNGNSGGVLTRNKRMRTSFKYHQLKTMKQWFAKNQNPDSKDLKQLAAATGLSKRVLQVWFQNARAKDRRNNLRNSHHFDHHNLHGQQSQSSSLLNSCSALLP